MSYPHILAGMRVLDFSKVLAGPTCTQYLADMGADVIKIEPPGAGDDTRGFPPFASQDGYADGTIFLSANRNKRSISVDLKRVEGRALVHRLVESADIVIESFGPGVAKRLEVDSETLSVLNPRLIHCSISGYGSVGVMRDGKGYDAVLQAFSGMMAITGEHGGKPMRTPFSPIDQATGMHALSGILAAVIQRQNTGKGMRVETSLFDTSLAFLGYILQGVWQTGREPQKPGSSHDSLCPYEVFDTADKPVLLGVANDSLWRKFCTVSGAQTLLADERFATNASRVAHREHTVAGVAAVLKSRTRDEWLSAFQAAGVPCSPVHTLSEMLEHPHTAASGMVGRYEHPVFGELKTVSQPLRLNGERSQVSAPAPVQGQHTREVLLDLGISPEEIARLQVDNTIACEPGSHHQVPEVA